MVYCVLQGQATVYRGIGVYCTLLSTCCEPNLTNHNSNQYPLYLWRVQQSVPRYRLVLS